MVHVDGPSTLVTRSIGDWDAARSCVPHPEIARIELAPGSRSRFVLASDGLWDFVSAEKAAAVAFAAPSAQRAADRLERLAVERSNNKFDFLKDDVSVVVVDVDLRDEETRAEAAAAARRRGLGGLLRGCCS